MTTKLIDYRPAPFITLEHDLLFLIDDHETRVIHRQKIQNNQAKKDADGWDLPVEKDAILNGEDLELLNISINGKALSAEEYRYEEALLTLFNVPDEFELSTEVRLYPEKNLQLSGLYRSNGIYCTQCEAEGFRRISFAFDRPDVLSIFKVRIESEKRFVQLSNGNLEESGELGNNRHFSQWHDPFPKPTYLFAVVVGELAQVSRKFKAPSGQQIDLRIYTEPQFIGQTDFAMQAIGEAIVWDEKRFNLKYDLNRFNIVAIGDFNMGAMENKSLNIFNTRCVLADPETATDDDFHAVRRVIAHEYFHNWTGNRVTCRDWFQLSLKEGLTVFRDQEFMADMGEKALERVQDVGILRAHQFPEDASPLKHPVQPQEYLAIDNFYTATVYEKGAEIIRMYHTILGEKRFQAGMKRYIERHDGQAVCIEDFAQAMSDDEFDFTGQFFDWYLTAGTPKVSFSSSYNQRERQFILSAHQDIQALSPSRPLMIPINLSLIQKNGRAYRFENGKTVTTLILDNTRNTWHFDNAEPDLIPILMQGFSAPVYYSHNYDNEELGLIVNHAEDGFARFEAMQMCYRRLFEQALHKPEKLKDYSRDVVELMADILESPTYSAGEKALLLAYPDLESLLNFLPSPIEMTVVIQTYQQIRKILALRLRQAIERHRQKEIKPSSPKYSVQDAGIRKLNGLTLRALSSFNEPEIREALFNEYQNASNMTERMFALNALIVHRDDYLAQALADFYNRFKHLPLVVDKWFAVQAKDSTAGALARLEALAQHEDFKITNPNRTRALLMNFARFNPLFHAEDGSGYRFFINQIKRFVDLNPQNSARCLNALAIVARMDKPRKEALLNALNELSAFPNLSLDVIENCERIKNGLRQT